MPSSKSIVLAGLIAGSFALSACGAGSSGAAPTTTSADQQQQMESGMQALKTDAAEMQGRLIECQGSGQPIPCIAKIVEDFGNDVSELGQTVDNVAAQVSGECAAKLEAVGGALDTLGSDFDEAGASLADGPVSAATSKLQQLSSQAGRIQQSLAGSGSASAACEASNG